MKPSVLNNPFSHCAALLGAVLAFAGPLVRAEPALKPPAILAFDATAETTLNLGRPGEFRGITELNWSVSDAAQLSISPDVGAVTGTSVKISPAATTTYTLTATNSAGSVTKSKTITVIVPPVIEALLAVPDAIRAGKEVKLSWAASGASYFLVTADNVSDSIKIFGNDVIVRPTTTTTYTVTAINAAGRSVKTITIPVAEAGLTPAMSVLMMSAPAQFAQTRL